MRKFMFLIVLLIIFQSIGYSMMVEGDNRKCITTAGTAEALVSATTSFASATICADPDNTGQIAIGTSPVASLTAPEGVFLLASDCYTMDSAGIGQGNLNLIKADATVSGECVSFHYWREAPYETASINLSGGGSVPVAT